MASFRSSPAKNIVVLGPESCPSVSTRSTTAFSLYTTSDPTTKSGVGSMSSRSGSSPQVSSVAVAEPRRETCFILVSMFFLSSLSLSSRSVRMTSPPKRANQSTTRSQFNNLLFLKNKRP
uniref:Uncharacterized protein n=1 Tax=Lotus japonicus TaxID=34305 RepID=I3SHA0_LOTJA|nr:unknown [Lotus japonicus]